MNVCLKVILLFCVCNVFAHAHEHTLTSWDGKEADFSLISGLTIPDVTDTSIPPSAFSLKFKWKNIDFDIEFTHRKKTINGEEFNWYYRGSGTITDQESGFDKEPLNYISLTFTENKVGIWQGAMSYGGSVFSFQPGRAVSTKYSKDDIVAYLEGANLKQIKKRRSLQTSTFQGEVFANCYQGQEGLTRAVGVGFVVDPPFVARVLREKRNVAGTNASKVSLEVDSIAELSNAIYTPQMNVALTVLKVVDQQGLFQEQVPNTFPLGCGNDRSISEYLETLAQWRTTNKSTEGSLWQVLTDCYPPPGVVGVAYVAQLCRNYGVGVNTSTGTRTWKTVAHEIGHNFGAGHSFENGQGRTGGIMDYGDGTLNGVFQFNQLRKNEVCGTIRNTMAGSRIPNCWRTLDNTNTGTGTGTGGGGVDVEYVWTKRVDGGGNDIYGSCLPSRTGTTAWQTVNRYTGRWQSSQYDCKTTTGQSAADDKCDLGNKPIFDNPDHNYRACTANYIPPQCGNGIIENGEICEPAVQGSCCTGQCAWSTATNCQATNPQYDAAFNYYGNKFIFRGNLLYRYANMDSTTVVGGWPRTITQVFPNLRNTKFANGIDAALDSQNKLIYMFKDFDFAQYDVSVNRIVRQGNVFSQLPLEMRDCGKIDAGMIIKNEGWLFCDSVYTIIPLGNMFSNVGPTTDLELPWPSSVVSGINSVMHNPDTGLTRFFNGGYYIQWSGRTIDLQAGSAKPIGQSVSGFVDDSPQTLGLEVGVDCPFSCVSCTTANDGSKVCTDCDDGLTLLPDGRCLESNIKSLLSFNLDDPNNPDPAYINGGSGTLNDLKNNDKFLDGLANNGEDTYCLNFDGDHVLGMNSLDQRLNDNFSLRISGMFRPEYGSGSKKQRFVTFKDQDNVEKISISFLPKKQCQPPDQCTCKGLTHPTIGDVPARCSQLYGKSQPSCYVDSNCPGAIASTAIAGEYYAYCNGVDCSDFGTEGSEQFELEVVLPSSTFTCFVPVPMTSGEFNKVEFVITENLFVTGVNGMYHERAYEDLGSQTTNKFLMGDWYIGGRKVTDNDTGLEGCLDSLQIEIDHSDHSAKSDSDDSLEIGVVIGAVCGVMVCFCCLAFVYYKKDKVLGTPRSKNTVNWNDAETGGKRSVVMSSTNQNTNSNVAMIKRKPKIPDNHPSPRNVQNSPPNRSSFNFGYSKNKKPVGTTAEYHYIDDSEKQLGPVSEAKLKIMYKSGGVSKDTYIWHEDFGDDWKPISSISKFSWK